MAQAVEKQLEDVGGRVQSIADAVIGNVVPQVDCALIGIDTFDLSGAIYHKAGTLPLALCCRQGAVPESHKPLSGQIFDRTPPQLITRIITEE